jgi:hypothetical protein
MQQAICKLLALSILLAGLGWSMDGHAVFAEAHEEIPSQAEHDDHQGDQPGGELCDHHCHAGSHLVAVPVLHGLLPPRNRAASLTDALRLPTSNGRDSPFRPPIS